MALVPKAKVRLLAVLVAVLSVLAVQVTAQAEPVIASYYSTWFVGKPTASGEPYDPNGFTAAHPYLPFGTYLLVSYNGRSVIVMVNDRMPYESDRDLDLSWAAARSIGLTDVGTAVVDAEVVETQPSSA
jgi:rare lipoprotein A